MIDILGPYLENPEGYQALSAILGLPIILAIPFVARLGRAEAEADAAATAREGTAR